MFNPIFETNVQGQNIQGVVHLQNQNYLCIGNIDQKVIHSHSHSYLDENHDEIEFYLGNSDRST